MVNKSFLYKVQSYDLASLFAAKLHAFLFRKYSKGRDYYDLLWFLARKTPVNYALLSAAAEQTEGGKFQLDAAGLKLRLIEKIDRTNFPRVAGDAAIFMERRQEEEYLTRDHFLAAVEKAF